MGLPVQPVLIGKMMFAAEFAGTQMGYYPALKPTVAATHGKEWPFICRSDPYYCDQIWP